MKATPETKTTTVALIVVPCQGEEEENVYPGGTAVVEIVGDVDIMIGQYSLTFTKTIYGATSVKMLLHQLWGAEGVKQCIGPQYNHRSIHLHIFGIVLVVVIYFEYM